MVVIRQRVGGLMDWKHLCIGHGENGEKYTFAIQIVVKFL